MVKAATWLGGGVSLLDLEGAVLKIADTRVVVDGKADEPDGKARRIRLANLNS